MPFADHLAELLPADLPHRDTVIRKSARHLDLIVDTNQRFNLTRILDEREAAIKHVLDSVLPWRWFADLREVFDIGTGAGFPGIPLAIVLPTVRFTLVESTGKKARFVDEAVVDLDLRNVSVMPRRAEEVLRGRSDAVIAARAVAPIAKVLEVLGPALRIGGRALLYKGPDADVEIGRAGLGMRKFGLRARVVDRYDLPDEQGSRTIVEIERKG